jgi:tryptophan 2-monooxygenase
MGYPPVRTLRAATGMAADLLQRDAIGVLTPGRSADIVAVPGIHLRISWSRKVWILS